MAASQVRRSIEVDATPDDVWELVVDDDERSAWFGGDTVLEPVPGGEGRFTDPDGTRRRAVVEHAEPGRRVSWTWWPDDDADTAASRVDVELTPSPRGTRVTVVETPMRPGSTASALASATGPLFDLELRVLVQTSARAALGAG